MDVGQKILAKVESEGKKRLRPSRIENRDYMVGGKRETGGEERERQVYTSHNSSSEQSVRLCGVTFVTEKNHKNGVNQQS